MQDVAVGLVVVGQYLFVDAPAVRDKLLVGAVTRRLRDYLPRTHRPLLALFVTLQRARSRRQRASGQDRSALSATAAWCAG